MKLEDYFPSGFKPHLVRSVPSSIIFDKAKELGLRTDTPAQAVIAAYFGKKWKCCLCGEQTALISFNSGFREYCSKKCSNNAPAVIVQKNKVNLEKYGNIFPTKSDKIRSKISDTKKSAITPTKSEVIKFLKLQNLSFIENNEYLSLNDGALRLYPLDNIQKYKTENKKTAKYFQEISIENEQNEIRTIWIKPWEFLKNTRKRNVLESYILNACNKTQNLFNGRDCEVRELLPHELRLFLQTNSFYGYRSATLNLGLYLKKDIRDFKKGTLVMLYSFGHPFFGGKNKKYDLEVIRASTLLNCQVRGGASKLFSHFVSNYSHIKKNDKIIEWNNVVYYVDYDHNSGKSLPHLGFDFAGYSSPGFMNFNTETGVATNRNPMLHAKIKEKVLAGEIIPIPNAGVKIFIYTKQQ